MSLLGLDRSAIALYAYAATLVFGGETAEGRAVFPDFGAAAWQLLILVTTANFPDVMISDRNNTERGRPTISSEPPISLKTRSFRLVLGPVFVSARDLEV